MSAFPPINPKIPGITNPNTISNQNNVVASPAVGGTGAINDPSTTLPFGYDSTSNNFYLELSNRTSGNVCTVEFYVDSSVHFVNPVFPNYGSGIGNYQIVGTNTNSFGTSGQVLTSQGANVLPVWTTPSIGSGTVTSVTFTGDGTVLSSTPSTAVTASGTVSATLKSQNANKILAGPTTGSAAAPTFRSLVSADIPSNLTITTPNIVGATSGSAITGSVGELVKSIIPFASAVNMTSTTPTNVTSISLTAGDWDIFGNAYMNNNSVVQTKVAVWISVTSATLPDVSLIADFQTSTGVFAIGGFSAPTIPLNITSTTTVYLEALSVFSAGPTTVCGAIYARRVR